MAKQRKKPTNVSIDHDLLARARAMDINLSRALEEKLSELVEGRVGDDWLRQNRTAIENYNARVVKTSILSDDEKLF